MGKERKTVRQEVIHRPTDIYPLLFIFIFVIHADPQKLFSHMSKALLRQPRRVYGEEKGREKRKAEAK